MDYDSLLELVQKRRSIRKLKPDPIPDEYIDKIIEVARWAPSGGNSQPWEFIVVNKQELRDQIIELIRGNGDMMRRIEETREPEELKFKWAPPGYVRAPVLIILCGDLRTKETYPLIARLVQGDSHFTSSLANAFLYMNLAVTSLGLGGQWVSAIAHPYVQPLVKKLLDVPRELAFYDMLAVGYPDTEPRPRLIRSRQEITHNNRYDRGKYKTDQQVREFIEGLRKR